MPGDARWKIDWTVQSLGVSDPVPLSVDGFEPFCAASRVGCTGN
jgi:hypothetical protein